MIGAAAAGAVGVGLNAQVGTEAAFLKDGSCVDFGFWDCLPVGSRCGQGLGKGAEGQPGTAVPSLCTLTQCATAAPWAWNAVCVAAMPGCCPQLTELPSKRLPLQPQRLLRGGDHKRHRRGHPHAALPCGANRVLLSPGGAPIALLQWFRAVSLHPRCMYAQVADLNAPPYRFLRRRAPALRCPALPA